MDRSVHLRLIGDSSIKDTGLPGRAGSDAGVVLVALAFPGGQCHLTVPLTGPMDQSFTGSRLSPDEALSRVWINTVWDMIALRRAIDQGRISGWRE